jgi:hypothetical protein
MQAKGWETTRYEALRLHEPHFESNYDLTSLFEHDLSYKAG